MTRQLPICSLSLDLDNQWSYMKTHGDAGWESFPSYLDLVVPRALEILDRFGWTITFFIVGQDAALEKNREALQAIAAAGHEIGNHSFNHEPWLHLYTKQRVADEISRAEEAIKSATGHHPRGFRGPGYTFSRTTLEVLAERGYLYDASTLPTYLGPLARAYFFHASKNLTTEERRQRSLLFGGFRDGLQPLKPFLRKVGGGQLLEIPVTTLPILKLPFHFSYLLYIATYSPTLSLLYFRSALALCRAMRVEPSLLLHPLDFLGSDDVPQLAFFPAMNLDAGRKADSLGSLLRVLVSRHSVVTMSVHSKRCLTSRELPIRSPAELDPKG
ncbi:MAG TPA: polysaccharide deacetylase family protein [Thermoanaerobaculales bacterium]|nr:polysaccharide deacetylase family protein [Thermoanaerobaculales bacterium]